MRGQKLPRGKILLRGCDGVNRDGMRVVEVGTGCYESNGGGTGTVGAMEGDKDGARVMEEGIGMGRG